jgi:thiosulfate/3-mercaptopyruvate sulfurtransferase
MSQGTSEVTSKRGSGVPVIGAAELVHSTQQAAPGGSSPAGARIRWVDCRYFLGAPGRGASEFEQGHIPSAVYADLEQDLSAPIVPGKTGRHPLPSPEAFAAKLSAWGIQAGDWVIAYDHADGSMAAARLWWLLRSVGHSQVSVLDGGLSAWLQAGGTLSSAAAVFEPSVYQPRVALVLAVDAAEVSSTLGRQGSVLLDARAPERYRGEVEPIDKVAGRIPTARSLPYATLMKQGRFAPIDEVRATLNAALGDVEPEAAVVYCGSGVTACQVLLAAEYAGVPGLRLFPGSYSEWIADGTRPTERG